MKAMDLVVSTFLLEQSCSVQLISFGSGFDTLYFRHREMISASGSAVFEVGQLSEIHTTGLVYMLVTPYRLTSPVLSHKSTSLFVNLKSSVLVFLSLNTHHQKYLLLTSTL